MFRPTAAAHVRERPNGASEPRSIGGSVLVRPNHLRLLDADAPPAGDPTLVESYRRLADVFHAVLAEQSLDTLLVRIADTVGDLIPLDTLTIYEADETKRVLKPVLVRDVYADEIMSTTISFAEGITGWAARHREAVLSNQAHLDPPVRPVPGTPMEPEARISMPLVAAAGVGGVGGRGGMMCRRGGEGLAVGMDECSGADAVRVAERIQTRLAAVDFPGIGRMTVSVGLALGPAHAMNPRELAACAEAA